MKYFFLLGRNPNLSVAEIFSYFEKNRIKVKDSLMKGNGFLADIDSDLDTKNTIKSLGGVLAIGKVLCSGSPNEIEDFIEKNDIYFAESIKFSYSLIDFSEDEEISSEILDVIKNKFKTEKLKARYKSTQGKVRLQGGDIFFGSPSKIKSYDILYFIFGDSKHSFGFIDKICDVTEIEKRDIGKPVRREELAISPRLAKVLINLSQVKPGKTLLDPFCGIGVILQEALLLGIDVIGVDIGGNAAENARKNLKWFDDKYKIQASYKILQGDSSRLKLERIAGIATEPSLGEVLRKIPSKTVGENMIKEYEDLMISVLNNVKKSLEFEGKIAFTAPLISTSKGKVFCDIKRICIETGLIPHSLDNGKIKFPIREFREKQIVGREFYVLMR